jgi:hypothetical protein
VRRQAVAQHVRVHVRWAGRPAAPAPAGAAQLAGPRRVPAADEQRRLVGAASRRAGQPGRAGRAARRGPPARCAACCPCPAHGRWRRRRRSSRPPRGRPAQVQPGSSATRRPLPYSSSTMAWSRAARRGSPCPGSACSASATAWSTDSALGSGLGALGARTPTDRVAGHHALRAPPAVQAAPGRQHQQCDAARRQAVARSLAAQPRTWCGLRGAGPRPGGQLLPAAQASVYMASVRGPAGARRAGGQVLQVALQRLGQIGALGHGPAARGQARGSSRATARRWPPRRCASGSRCPCRRCSAWGRASPAPAGRRRLGRAAAQRHQGQRRVRHGVGQPAHGLEAGVGAAVGHASGCRQSCFSVVADRLAQRPAGMRRVHAPHAQAACGIRNSCLSSSTSTAAARGVAPPASARASSGAGGRRWPRCPGRGGSSR